MKSFIFIDGTDGTGKSTLCHNLYNYYTDNSIERFTLENLPSSSGPLAYIRDIIKDKDLHCNSDFRQAIHTICQVERFLSHVNENVIWDRSTASTFAYGCICGVPEKELDLLLDIQIKVLLSLPVKLYFIFLTHNNSLGFRGNSDGSFYESLDLSNINHLYMEFSDYLYDRYKIPSDVIDVTNLTEIEECDRVIKLLSVI